MSKTFRARQPRVSRDEASNLNPLRCFEIFLKRGIAMFNAKAVGCACVFVSLHVYIKIVKHTNKYSYIKVTGCPSVCLSDLASLNNRMWLSRKFL